MSPVCWALSALFVAVVILAVAFFAVWDRLNGVSEGGRSNHGRLGAFEGQLGSLESRAGTHTEHLTTLGQRCDTNHSFTKDVFDAHRSLNARAETARQKINENFRVTGERLSEHKQRFGEMERKFAELLKALGNRVSNCEAEVRQLRGMFPSFMHTPTSMRRDLGGLSSRVARLETERAELQRQNAHLDTTCRDQEVRIEILEKELADGGYIRASDLGIADFDPTPRLAPMPMLPSPAAPFDGWTSAPPNGVGMGGVNTSQQLDREKRAAVARVLGEAVLSGFPRSAGDLRQAVAIPMARQIGAERIGGAILGRLESQTWAKDTATLTRLAAEFLAERGGDLAEAYERVFKETAAEGPIPVPPR